MDVSQIPELRGVEWTDSEVVVGAATTYTEFQAVLDDPRAPKSFAELRKHARGGGRPSFR